MRLYNNNCLSSEICKISFWFCAVVCSFTRTQCDLSCRKQTLKKEFHDNVIKLIDNIKEVLNCHKIFGSKYGLWILKLDIYRNMNELSLPIAVNEYSNLLIY